MEHSSLPFLRCLHSALAVARRISVHVINFQLNLVLENAVALLDGQLPRILCGVGLLDGERDAVHLVIPHVLWLHVQSGHFIRIVNVNLEERQNKYFKRFNQKSVH